MPHSGRAGLEVPLAASASLSRRVRRLNGEGCGQGAERGRGYRVDYRKLKTLCRQSGLKLVDLYEPGMVKRQLISEGTLKKWRKGGRASSDSLLKVAEALSEHLHWRVDWRELTQRGLLTASLNRRLAIPPFRAAAAGQECGGAAEGFRASIVAQLWKVQGLRVVSVPALESAAASQPRRSGLEADVVLSGALRSSGELSRLDIELTDAKTCEVLWASSYPFSAPDQLSAQAAIAAEVADQIGRALAAA